MASYIWIWPIIIIGIIVFLVWTEDGSQNCDGRWCNNTLPIIYPSDNPRQMIDKIKDMIRLNHTVVGWRRALLVAIVCTLLILLIIINTFPSGIMVFIVVILIFVTVYMSSAWHVEHWHKMNDNKIESALYKFRSSITSI